MKRLEIRYTNGDIMVEWFGKEEYIKGYKIVDKTFEITKIEIYNHDLTTSVFDLNKSSIFEDKIKVIKDIVIYNLDASGEVKDYDVVYTLDEQDEKAISFVNEQGVNKWAKSAAERYVKNAEHLKEFVNKEK